MGSPNKSDRLFNPYGRRHYRKNYDLRELPIGFAILICLAGVAGWVGYKGAHPDPSLLALDVVPAGEKVGAQPNDEAAGRGAFPTDLALEGWQESGVRTFEADNLYVKINGRAGYYKSFGVQRLHFMSVQRGDDPSVVVDLELYDHGTSANALGAYNGERGEDSQPEVTDRGLSHYSRNAMYLTRGRYYLRAVGSSESEAVIAQLENVKARFEAEVEGEALPWSYALFIGKMGFESGALAYFPENAFNFSFANQVNVARLADETELFVVLAADEQKAQATAERYLDGFREYGADVEPGWIEDRYIQTIAHATEQGRWVIGVRGAPNLAAARAALARLKSGLDGFDVPEGARAAPDGEAVEGAPAEADPNAAATAAYADDGDDEGGGEAEEYDSDEGEQR